MSGPILEALDLHYTYPDGTRALRGVTLRVPEGGKVAVLGPNGAGKTTLFLHLNGLLRPRKGTVRFAGREVCYDRKSLGELRRAVGMVFQDPDSQLFCASVFEEVSFGPANLGLALEEVRRRVREALRATDAEDLAERPTHYLSYGQKKRVCVAGVLAMEPRVLICDEPTAGLDPRQSAGLVELLDRVACRSGTVLIATQDVDLAYSWADRVVVLKEGRVLGEGTPTEVFLDEDLLRRADLTAPWVVEVYRELVRRGLVPPCAPVPRNKNELFGLLPAAGAGVRREA
ncbi:MAG: energy-coupling factor ABC transporter ATP-binding protein [Desulfotomaculales bacterium]